MTRSPLVLAGLGVVALAACVVGAGLGGALLSYLGAWLVLLALPAGALPLVIVLDRIAAHRPDASSGASAGALLAALRPLAALMPAAALLTLPMLVAPALLYPWASVHLPETALARIWYGPAFFGLRSAVYLAAWCWLALRATCPGGLGDDGAMAGFFLHAILGTLVATDLVLSLDHRLGSGLGGILAMTAWSGLALGVALLRAPVPAGDGLRLLAGLLALWAFLHFVHFLTLWSANRPEEVLWSLARGGGLGRGLALTGGALVLAAALATLRPGARTMRALAAASVAVHALEMFWLVTPALRDRFVFGWSDLAALVGVGALALALAMTRFAQGGTPRRVFP